MTIFSKQQICRYWAEKNIEMTPAFELRKLKVSESVSDEKRQYYLDLYHLHFNEASECFDPPRHYLSYPVLSLEMDCTLDRLTSDDEHYLCQLFKLNSLFETIESAEKYKGYYKLFTESENKPDWDLVRVLSKDTLSNYRERQQEYERLLNGGLNTLIKKGNVIKLDEDEYELKQNNVVSRKPFSSIPVFECVAWYESIGNEMASYRQQINKNLNDTETLKFSLQINGIIKDALNSGELPVYRLPTYKLVEYSSYQLNLNDVVCLDNVKRVIESKTLLSLPDDPVFMKCWPEIERKIIIKTNLEKTEEINSKNIQISAKPNRKLEEQQDAILNVIKRMKIEPMEIPDGKKGEIREICESDFSSLFKPSSFERAWKMGINILWKMEYHDRYARRGKN